MIKYLLIVIISFLGIYFGSLLKKIAKEEVKPGKKLFINFKYMILLILVIILLYHSKFTVMSLIFFIIGILISAVLRIRYLYLGLALFSSLLVSKELFLIVSSLIFLYGLFYGTLSNKNIKYNLIFFLPLILLLFKESLIDYNYLILSFTAGTLFLRN